MSAVATGDKIYPPRGASIDYYAYYPYNATVSGTTYKIDVTNQTDLTKIDLMWAKAIGLTTSNVALNFSHQLTKLVFNIEAGGVDVSDLSGMTATITGVNAKADFDLKTGTFSNSTTADITLKVTAGATSGVATITAIVAPMASLTTCKVTFTAEGKSFQWAPATTAWAVGTSYTYNITVGKTFIPYATEDTDINTAYHTVANVTVGKGDPCRLVGYTRSFVKSELAADSTPDNGMWRLPTSNENGTFSATYSDWITGTTNGRYFGTTATDGSAGEFLPAAGYRYYLNGAVTNQG